MTMRALLVADLIRDEGLALKPYVDSVGKTTIGVGRNLDDVGITEAEAISLLNYDIDRAISDAHRALPSFGDAPEPVQRALVNMAFNLGLPRLRGFKKMLKAP